MSEDRRMKTCIHGIRPMGKCGECFKDARNKSVRKHYQTHKKQVKKYRKQYRKRPERKLKQKESFKKYYYKLKNSTLIHYSGDPPKCACCGETIYEFLTIDHIDNKGAEHRKKIGISGGASFYIWLKHNGYPKGFQILCLNCNWAKGIYGICPHQRGLL